MLGALDGIRVIDFGQYLAGPLTAQLLCDQGAEVIRVDPPGGPRWRHPANVAMNRGKRSVVSPMFPVSLARASEHVTDRSSGRCGARNRALATSARPATETDT